MDKLINFCFKILKDLRNLASHMCKNCETILLFVNYLRHEGLNLDRIGTKYLMYAR